MTAATSLKKTKLSPSNFSHSLRPTLLKISLTPTVNLSTLVTPGNKADRVKLTKNVDPIGINAKTECLSVGPKQTIATE